MVMAKRPIAKSSRSTSAYVDLGHIDLLVRDGFYSNRSDFIRHRDPKPARRACRGRKKSAVAAHLELGLRSFSRRDLEAVQRGGRAIENSRFGIWRPSLTTSAPNSHERPLNYRCTRRLHASAEVRAALRRSAGLTQLPGRKVHEISFSRHDGRRLVSGQKIEPRPKPPRGCATPFRAARPAISTAEPDVAPVYGAATRRPLGEVLQALRATRLASAECCFRPKTAFSRRRKFYVSGLSQRSWRVELQALCSLRPCALTGRWSC